MYGYYYTRWQTVLWFVIAKVAGIVLKTARPWGSNSIAVKDDLGEPGGTRLYAGLPSVWS